MKDRTMTLLQRVSSIDVEYEYVIEQEVFDYVQDGSLLVSSNGEILRMKLRGRGAKYEIGTYQMILLDKPEGFFVKGDFFLDPSEEYLLEEKYEEGLVTFRSASEYESITLTCDLNDNIPNRAIPQTNQLCGGVDTEYGIFRVDQLSGWFPEHVHPSREGLYEIRVSPSNETLAGKFVNGVWTFLVSGNTYCSLKSVQMHWEWRGLSSPAELASQVSKTSRRAP